MNSRPVFVTAWATALAGFVLLCVLAAFSDKFPGDVWMAHRIQELDVPGLARALDWAEDASDLPEVVLVCTAAIALLLLVRDPVGALILPVAVSARVLITWALKGLIERPRPSPAIVHFEDQPSTFSFPSGHAMEAFVLYGLLFYFAALHISDLRLRLPVQSACVAIIVLTGLERVYVGHHWASDVLGGYYAGALIISAIVAGHQVVRRHTSNLRADCSFSRSAAATDPE
jgi:membrane-associated phospholipid phosphatase